MRWGASELSDGNLKECFLRNHKLFYNHNYKETGKKIWLKGLVFIENRAQSTKVVMSFMLKQSQ